MFFHGFSWCFNAFLGSLRPVRLRGCTLARLKDDLLIAKPLDLAEEQEVVQLVGAEVECRSNDSNFLGSL